jgi:uncharacterized cupredoxin-like copper-binding protein
MVLARIIRRPQGALSPGRRARSIFALAAVAIAMLALLPVASAGAGLQARAGATTIQVTGKEFSFKLSANSIAKPGTVTFNFKNAGSIDHDFKIAGKKTPRVKPGKSARLVVTFKKEGKYPYLCTVPGHAAAGMKGVFTVR